MDTAGIRKKGRWDHKDKLERLAVEEALRAVRYANVRPFYHVVRPLPRVCVYGTVVDLPIGSRLVHPNCAQVVVLVLDGQQLRLRRQEQAVADTAFKCVRPPI